jgi:hypothetical protein
MLTDGMRASLRAEKQRQAKEESNIVTARPAILSPGGRVN